MIKRLRSLPAAALALVLSSPAYAAGSGMPWEAPLQQILDSVQGPVAKIIAVMIIIVTGVTLAFGETSGGFRKLIQIVFGLSIAFAASTFFLTFFRTVFFYEDSGPLGTPFMIVSAQRLAPNQYAISR